MSFCLPLSSIRMQIPSLAKWEEKTAYKITTLAVGILLLTIGGLAVAGRIFPHTSSPLLFSSLSNPHSLALIVSSLGLSTLFSALGVKALTRKKDSLGTPETKEEPTDSKTIIHYHPKTGVGGVNGINSTFIPATQEHQTVAWAFEKGHRSSMEDAHISGHFSIGEQTVQVFGVFDGHNGADVANFVAEHLLTFLSCELQKLSTLNDKTISNAIKKAFANIDAIIKGDTSLNGRSCGSCAAVTLICNNKLYVANLGDSRTVLFNNGEAKDLSKDAKASVEEFAQAVRDRGGCVIYNRVMGQLAVTTAFGDWDMGVSEKGKKIISSEPEIQIYPLDQIQKNKGNFLIIACDGLWDVMSSKEACEALNHTALEESASHLVEEALQKGSRDNISVGVIYF